MTQALNDAIAQAVAAEQQRSAELKRQWEQERQEHRQALIEVFKLPFDAETGAILPPITYEFWRMNRYNYDRDEIAVACFTHADLVFKFWCPEGSHTTTTWRIAAYSSTDIQASEESEVEDYSPLLEETFHIYPNDRYQGYLSPEQLGSALLLFIHRAIEQLGWRRGSKESLRNPE